MRHSLMAMLLVVFVLGTVVPAAAVTYEEIDLGGRTVTLSPRFTTVTPFGPRGEFDWFDPDPRLQAHIETIEEMFNANIEFVNVPGQAGAFDYFATHIMVDDMADYAVVSRDALPRLVAEGFLQPLNDILEPDFNHRFPETFRPTPEISDFMGQTYMIQPLNYTLHPGGIFWNKDMFEREGLPSLYTIFAEDAWDYDTLAGLARELTRDTTGDGNVDQWGFGYGSHHRVNWIGTNNGALAEYRDGRMVATLHEERTIGAWDFLADLVQDGFAVEDGWQGNLMAQGSIGIRAWWTDAILYDTVQNDMEDAIGFIPYPMGPLAERRVSPSDNLFLAVIPVTTENPRAVIEVANALFQVAEPYIDLETWSDNFWDYWGRFAHDRETLEYFDWANRNVTSIDFNYEANDLGFMSAFLRAVGGETSFSAAMAELEPAFQAVLDEMFEQ